MLTIISFLLNIPYTLIGFALALLSLPTDIKITKRPFAFVVSVKRFWWVFGYMRNARAMVLGNIILLGPGIEAGDLEHELVHIRQYRREPFIHPFLYYIELMRKGYRNNKYEVEAYNQAGNLYKETLS